MILTRQFCSRSGIPAAIAELIVPRLPMLNNTTKTSEGSALFLKMEIAACLLAGAHPQPPQSELFWLIHRLHGPRNSQRSRTLASALHGPRSVALAQGTRS